MMPGISPNAMKSLAPLLMGAGLSEFANSIKKIASVLGLDQSQAGKAAAQQPGAAQAGAPGQPQAQQASPNPVAELLPQLAQLMQARQQAMAGGQG